MEFVPLLSPIKGSSYTPKFTAIHLIHSQHGALIILNMYRQINSFITNIC